MRTDPRFMNVAALIFSGLLSLCRPVPAHAQWLHTVRAWGSNAEGQLGNGTNTNSSVPIQTSSLAGVIAVSAGWEHSLAVKQDGTVWAWGWNHYGQLGDGTTVDKNSPVQVQNLTNVVTVSASCGLLGAGHSLAVRQDGTVWAWGYNESGQLGNASTTNSAVPVPVANLSNVIAVASGQFHSLALKSDGTVWAWGYNFDGELGNGANGDSAVPVQVINLTGVTAISAGGFHNLALKSDGTVWAWGGYSNNNDGELGDGTTGSSRNTPVQVVNITGSAGVAAGGYHSVALMQDGTVWAWGYNFDGSVGNGTNSNTAVPAQVSNITGVTAISAGGFHNLALKDDGTLWTWGGYSNNNDGELGNGTTGSSSNIPVQVIDLPGGAIIAAGGYHNLVVPRGEPFDMTGAGANELLWRNTVDGSLNYVQLAVGGASGYFGELTPTISSDWQVVAQPDINGDGIPDIVWQSGQTGDVTYWLMNGAPSYTGTWGYIAQGLPAGWNVVAAADMDGDGAPDLVFQNSQSGDVTYLQVINGVYTGRWAYLSQGLPPIWKVVGAVDLFGDGNNDLVWWNSQTGDVTYYHMNRTEFTGDWGYIAHAIPTDWRVVGMADFTGDGLPDIVWQNTLTTDVTEFQIVDGLWTGQWSYLARGVQPVWQLTGMR